MPARTHKSFARGHRRWIDLWLLIALGACGSVRSTPEPQIQYGYNQFVEYYEGSEGSPLLLTVPQGGSLVSHRIPTRYRGCWNEVTKECRFAHYCAGNETDQTEGEANEADAMNARRCQVPGGGADYTIPLGKMARWWIGQTTGLYPHLVLSTLHRKYMDPDASEDVATFGNAEAALAYEDYHGFIQAAIDKGVHFLVNIHGHGRLDDHLVLKYLRQPATNVTAAWTSMDYVYDVTHNVTSGDVTSHDVTSLDDLLVGPESLGAYFQRAGYTTIPSPQHPSSLQRYLRGDYTLHRYAHPRPDLPLPSLSAVHLSVPRSLRGGAVGPEFAEDLGRTLLAFLSRHLPACGQPCREGSADVDMMEYFLDNAAATRESGGLVFLLWALLTTWLNMMHN